MKTIEEKRKYNREYVKRRRKEDPLFREKLLSNQRKWRSSKSAKEKEKEYRKIYDSRPERKKKMRDASFKAYHGISKEEADQLIFRQNGRCAICGELPTGKGNCSRLHVDHDHSTNKIRGMLCNLCNRAIGFVREDTFILLKMVQYLERNK